MEGAGRYPAEHTMSAEVCPCMREDSDPQSEALLEQVVDSDYVKHINLVGPEKP